MKEKVIDYLKSLKTGETPTKIGLSLGKDYNDASSSVMFSLKSLVKEGKVIRKENGRKVTYKWIK